MKTLHMVSLGCPKNLVDSEVMLGVLTGYGMRVVQEPAEADVLLVNTCGFIRSAVEESIDEILGLAAFKKKGGDKLLVVTGCLVQRYGKRLREELPEVDLFVGTDEYDRIDKLLERVLHGNRPLVTVGSRPTGIMDSRVARRAATPPHRSYLKVTEGCDNRCTYCLIPRLRGPLRSRSIDDLVVEAVRLEAAGVKELTLIAQDLTAYGDDSGGGERLPLLLEALHQRTAIPWLRLLYLYPDKITRELLSVIAASPRILPYFDIPIQHVSSRVLRRMNRRYDRSTLERLLQTIRELLPEAALRTTLMVGFPGETEEDFNELVDFLRIHKLDHVGVFRYEDEEECAAHGLDGKCSEELKEERFDQLMRVQAEISAGQQQRYVGTTLEVLVEGVSRESDLLLEGRTRFQAADIDGCVYISRGTASPGDLVEVRITAAHPYDLVGEITTQEEEEAGGGVGLLRP